MFEDGMNERDAANRLVTKGKRRRSIAWLLAVCAVIFLPLTMTIQAMLRKLEDENVFTTPQIVYDILIFVGVVVSLPAMAIVTWMYLKRHPKPRREWAIWPLAAGRWRIDHNTRQYNACIRKFVRAKFVDCSTLDHSAVREFGCCCSLLVQHPHFDIAYRIA